MTQERRDKRLMLDMLRMPATIFYRDKHIVILQPVGLDSYNYYAPGPLANWEKFTRRENLFIIRTNSKEYFTIKRSVGMSGGVFEFGVSAYLDAHVGNGEFDVVKLYHRSMEEYLKKYPSLYDAFGEMAKKMAFLPMIKDQSDKNIWEALDTNIRNLRYINNLTHKRKVKILERWPSTIKMMDQTQELCDLVVAADGINILYIEDRFKNQKLCLRAVIDSGSALQYIPGHLQTEKICLSAIKQSAMALKHAKNPTMKMFVAAVNRSPDAWNLIKKEKLRKEIRKAKKQKKYRS